MKQGLGREQTRQKERASRLVKHAASAFALDFYHRDWRRLDDFVSANERRQQMGPGRRQYRIRVGPNGWPRLLDQAPR